MFESLVTAALNRYLGAYVEGINPEQLRLAVWQGDVHLEGLTLRTDALSMLLPFDITGGSIGRLSLKIPWTQLRKQPVIISVDSLTLLAGPGCPEEYDAATEAVKDAVAKAHRLARRDIHADIGAASQTASLLDLIVDNLQIVVHAVHVHYVDRTTSHGHAFVAGFTLGSVSITPTDANWQERFVGERQLLAHKCLQMKDFAVYWRSDSPVTTSFESPLPENYLIKPISTTLRFRRNKGGVPGIPKIFLEIDLDAIAVNLTASQLRDLACVRSAFQHQQENNASLTARFQRVRFYRPPSAAAPTAGRLRGNWRLWWYYAAKAVIVARHSAGFWIDGVAFVEFRRMRQTYVSVWLERATSTALPAAQQDILAGLEAKLSAHQIIEFRCRAELQLKANHDMWTVSQHIAEERARGTVSQSWYSRWFGGTAAPALGVESGVNVETRADDEDTVLLVERRRALLDTAQTDTPTDSIAPTLSPNLAHVELRLNALSIVLLENISKPASDSGALLRLAFANLICSFEQRQQAGAFLFDVALRHMQFTDLVTPASQHATLVQPAAVVLPRPQSPSTLGGNASVDSECSAAALESVFFARVESQPCFVQADYLVRVYVKPLDIILVPVVMLAVANFMSGVPRVPPPTSNHDLSDAQYEKLLSLRRGDAPMLPSVDVLLDISAPTVYIPHDATVAGSSVVVIDLGHLKVLRRCALRHRAPFMGSTEPGPPESMTDGLTAAKPDSEEDDGSVQFVTPPSSPSDSDHEDLDREDCVCVGGSLTEFFTTPVKHPSLPSPSHDLQADLHVLKTLGRAQAELQARAHDYHNFMCVLSDVQVLALDGTCDWNFAGGLSAGSYHVVEGFTVESTLRVCRHQDDLTCTKADVSARLPLLNIHITEATAKDLLLCISQVTRVFATEPATERAVGNDSLDIVAKNVCRATSGHLWQQRLLVASFTIEALVVKLDTCVPLICVNISGIKSSVIRRPFDDRVTLIVQNLHIVDFTQADNSSFRLLADADSRNQDFVRVDITKVCRIPGHKAAVSHGFPLRELKFAHHASSVDDSFFALDEAVDLPLIVDFSLGSLFCNVNRPTFAAVLDFFHGISNAPGSPEIDGKAVPVAEPGSNRAFSGDLKHVFRFTAVVAHLQITLVDDARPFARVVTGDMSLAVDSLAASMLVRGRLGSLHVADLTPAGALYRAVFATSGTEMFDFELFRHTAPTAALAASDPFQVYLSAKMASVRIVYTRRFLVQLSAFASKFQEMQAVLSLARRTASGILSTLDHSRSFLKLSVVVDRPCVVIPRNSFSDDVLEADLGCLTLENKLEAAPTGHGTDTAVVMPLDVIYANILGMNLFSAKRRSYDPVKQGPAAVSSGATLLRAAVLSECAVSVRWAQVTDSQRLDLPLAHIAAGISNVNISLTHSQFELFMGMLNENQGCELQLVTLADGSLPVQADPAVDQRAREGNTEDFGLASVSRSAVVNSVTIARHDIGGVPLRAATLEAKWVTLFFCVDLQNVQVQLYDDGADGQAPRPLALLKLNDSAISYQNQTNGADAENVSTCTFFSKEIVAVDTRCTTSPNYFVDVLQPINLVGPVNDQQIPPQLQVTYRSTAKSGKVSVILNKSRLLVAPEWLSKTKEWLFNLGKPQLVPSVLVQPSGVGQPGGKYGAVTAIQQAPRCFEVTLSVTEPQFVFVEDRALQDSNAVVVKFCAVVNYLNLPSGRDASRRIHSQLAAGHSEEQFVCVIESLEVFSCRINQESATALSIVDPCKVHLELQRRTESDGCCDVVVDGLLDVGTSSKLMTVSRFSYRDLRLFLSLAQQYSSKRETHGSLAAAKLAAPTSEEVLAVHRCLRLMEMGGSSEQCVRSLVQHSGSTEMAALSLCLGTTSSADTSAAPATDRDFLAQISIHHDALEQNLLDLVHSVSPPQFQMSFESRFLDDQKSQLTATLHCIIDHQAQLQFLKNGGTASEEAWLRAALISVGFMDADVWFALDATDKTLCAVVAHLVDNASSVAVDSSTAHVPGPLSPALSRQLETSERHAVLSSSVITGSAGQPGIVPLRDESRVTLTRVFEASTPLAFAQLRPHSPPSSFAPQRANGANGRPAAVPSLQVVARIYGMALCIIDDCQSRDTPLVELTATNITLSAKRMVLDGAGVAVRASATLGGNYYNTAVSSWEPFVEPWAVAVLASIGAPRPQRPAYCARTLVLSAESRMEVNVTPQLMKSIVSTLANWTADYQLRQPLPDRVPFIPYRLRNKTGCRMQFWLESGRSTPAVAIVVEAGAEMPFHFDEGLNRFRHGDLHRHDVHKISLQMEGWNKIHPPVTIDRVGTLAFFMEPVSAALFPTRVVVCIEVADGCKVISVCSALNVVNSTTLPVEVRLEFRDRSAAVILPPIPAQASASIPVNLTSSVMKFRPRGWGHQWSTTGVSWESFAGSAALRTGRRVGLGITCRVVGDPASLHVPVERFRCGVSVVREPFPDVDRVIVGHSVTLLPPLVIENLLPCPLQYLLSGPKSGAAGPVQRSISGDIAGGMEWVAYEANVDDELTLCVKIAGHGWCDAVALTSGAADVCLRLVDGQRRTLRLHLTNHKIPGSGGCRRIRVFAQYWMVNHSGLPVVYRQHNRSATAAGQMLQDVERLCSATPQLFSCDDETLSSSGNKCCIRIGNSSWSQEVALDAVGRVGVLLVRQSQADVARSKPEQPLSGRVYQLGVEIAQGVGRFQLTKVISFVPHFVLVNLTLQTLEYTQHQSGLRPEMLASQRTAAFHWPRAGVSERLCLRYKAFDTAWEWSKGFPIHELGVFHVKLLSQTSADVCLLRVEVKLVGAAVQILFSDGSGMPPFRIDNQSFVAVTFHQDGVANNMELASMTAVPFAWDDLSKALKLVVCVKDAPYHLAQSYDLRRIYHSRPLHYPQMFHVVGPGGLVIGADAALVTHNRVQPTLRQRTPRDPHQLWQFSEHERLRNQAGFYLQIGSNRILELWKPTAENDGRACPEQQWVFQQGRLVSRLDASAGASTHVLVVDCKVLASERAAVGLIGTSLVVCPSLRNSSTPSQMFHIQKSPSGSGTLAVRIQADGPTRVLVLTDAGSERPVAATSSWTEVTSLEDDVLDTDAVVDTDAGEWVEGPDDDSGGSSNDESVGRGTPGAGARCKADSAFNEIDIRVHMPGGIGLSLLNQTPAEVVYLSLRGLNGVFSVSAAAQTLELTVQHLQIDNQLQHASRFPVMLHPLAAPPTAPPVPAFRLSAVRSRDSTGSADVFKLFEIQTCSFDLKLEEMGMLRLLELVKQLRQVDRAEPPDARMDLKASCTQVAELLPGNYLDVQQRRITYFEILKIFPLNIHASYFFATTELDAAPAALLELKNTSGLSSMVKFEDAPLHMGAFILQRPFANLADLLSMVQKHYKQELLRQLHMVLGSVDFLGNPIGVLQNVTTGLHEFMQETSTGNVFGGGVTLAQHVTAGLADSVSKISGSISDGLGKATMDHAFQASRERRLASSKDTAGHLSSGVKSFTRGLYSGLTGIVTQPVRGFQREGVEGLFAGAVRGLVGVVTKPLAGVFDLASETTAAVRHSAQPTRSVVARARLPRCVGPDQILRPFSAEDAFGCDVLRCLTSGNSDNGGNSGGVSEAFAGIIALGHAYGLLLISSERVLVLSDRPRDDTPTRVSTEVWFSGLFGYRVVLDHSATVYLEFTVSEEMLDVIQERLELRPTEACRLTPARWRTGPGECHRRAVRVRCSTPDVATRALARIQFAMNFWAQRNHAVPLTPPMLQFTAAAVC